MNDTLLQTLNQLTALAHYVKSQPTSLLTKELTTALVIDKLAHAHCHSLTLALNAHFVYPIAVLLDDDLTPVHSFVMPSKGYSLDGYGLSDLSVTIERYQKLANMHGHGQLTLKLVSRRVFTALCVNSFKLSHLEVLTYFSMLLEFLGLTEKDIMPCKEQGTLSA